MPFRLQTFADVPLDDALLEHLIARHDAVERPALERLWAYYRNPITGSRDGRVRLAQECGLPPRMRGRTLLDDDRTPAIREIVIENDIAWRIHALVDFLVGRPISILSAAPDETKRAEIQRLLDSVFESSGGSALLQDAALLASVYGHVDFLLRTDGLFGARGGSPSIELALRHAPDARIEALEPTRAIPLVSSHDYRRLDAMVIRFEREAHEVDRPGAARRFLSRRLGATQSSRRRTVEVVEVHSARAWQRYEDGELVAHGEHRVGEVPVVHVQNVSQPFCWTGLSDVEPLIPLQDELNTRLSDRANRVTMQAFRMYLAKGLDAFADGPVGPGQVFSTDNPDASVEVIGADAHSPSEEAHIEELREALDKASSVTPVAAGVLRARLGQLSSENALRITLLGALARTARRQGAFGRAIASLSRMTLRAFDEAGLYRTTEADRAVRVVWPEPLPTTERERLDAAARRSDLGVPRERVLASIGESPTDPGVE